MSVYVAEGRAEAGLCYFSETAFLIWKKLIGFAWSFTSNSEDNC